MPNDERTVDSNRGPAGQPPPTKDAKAAPTANAAKTPPRELTPEEQMALYEKELKESDWGHQPC